MMLNLKVWRMVYADAYTLGCLYVDGAFECFTLEPSVKGKLIPSNPGRYPVELTFSPRFQRTMPHIQGVPGFEGVRIHTGNTADDTEGCLLVGNILDKDGVLLESKLAYDSLFQKLKQAQNGIELLVN